MAEVLEAMGFPSEWCERALKSASGLETAVDLLLQWQAHGMPQYNLPLSVRPSSSPPHSPSAAVGKSVLQSTQSQQQQASSGLPSRGTLPTLRLQPLLSLSPRAAASKAAVINDERNQFTSPTQNPSTSSSFCPSSLEAPSGVNHACGSESPSGSFRIVDAAELRCIASAGRMSGASADNNANNSEPQGGFRMAATGNSNLDCAISRGPEAGGAGSSSRTVYTPDSSDAVVPDAYAEERKVRYAAARRAKQEKEEEKARIRQHMQEDMALRRFRNSYQSPLPGTERNKAAVAVAVAGSLSSSRSVSKDTAVELHIRCPGNQNLKASFTAGASLKDVRDYVEHELQQPQRLLGSQDRHSGLWQGSTPFSGQSARLSSDRQAERELLQAARENYEVQTSRILASAKSLRDVSGTAATSSRGIIYFLIPFPRQEFFTESAMETTLSEAQLVPRGSLVVQYGQMEVEVGKSVQVQSKNYSGDVDLANLSVDSINPVGGPGTAEIAVVEENTNPILVETESDNHQKVRVPNSEKVDPAFDLATNETMQSRRILEMEGERVRVRELALQAAAKRMTEAAKIFHAGLPLTEGETGEAFHFPSDGEHHNVRNDPFEITPLPQDTAPVVASVARPVGNESIGLKAAGADAELLDARCPTDEHLLRRDRPDGSLLDRSRNGLHRQAVAAAEERIRNSQLPQSSVLRGVCRQDPEEAESRNGENETESLPRGRSRIPESSRLLSRPEKLQRTSDTSPVTVNGERHTTAGSNRQRQPPVSTGGASRPGPLEAALQRCKAASEGDCKGKAVLEEHSSLPVTVPSSSIQLEAEKNSSLRIRLEDSNVVLHTFPANTVLRAVRDSVVPEGADVCEYGFVVPFPEPHFVDGDALAATLEEAGLVPQGTIHLTKVATRGMVRQGRRVSRRRRYLEDSDAEGDQIEDMIRHLRDRVDNRPDLSYEELMELEESIGRVNVGVPEEVITTLPTHVVKAKKVVTTSEDAADGEPDLCIVCMADMVDGEEALSLPCFHTFHTVCIRQWLVQSTYCPTCKQALV